MPVDVLCIQLYLFKGRKKANNCSFSDLKAGEIEPVFTKSEFVHLLVFPLLLATDYEVHRGVSVFCFSSVSSNV